MEMLAIEIHKASLPTEGHGILRESEYWRACNKGSLKILFGTIQIDKA